LKVVKGKTYSRFFTELLELVINAVYVNFLSEKPESKLRDGAYPADDGGRILVAGKSL